jgi:hypothetical protein
MDFGNASVRKLFVLSTFKILEDQGMSNIFASCVVQFLTLRGRHTLHIFGSEVLRRKLGPKNGEVSRKFGMLHKEKLRYLYRVVNSRRLRWGDNLCIQNFCRETYWGMPTLKEAKEIG